MTYHHERLSSREIVGPGWDAGVDVWPMLMGTNATQPREYTPTSDYGIVWGTWKLVVLGGQSNYYTENATHINPPEWTLPCLAGSDDRQGGVDNPGDPSCPFLVHTS